MKKICLLFGILCCLTGCEQAQPVQEDSTETTVLSTEYTQPSETENEESEPAETEIFFETADAIGISILLPANTSWITDRKYTQLDENSVQIEYYDTILEADCTLLAVKDGTLNLPDNEYDESLNETWTARTISSKALYVKVQHTQDKKAVLATWEYDNYKFAIWCNMPDGETDSSTIPKTALYVIQNLD